MKTCIPLLALFIAVCLPMTTRADEAATADQQFTSISRLLERADQALENNALADAGRLYGATVRAYEQFAQSFPTFAPDLVRFRIAYCRNQMTAVRQRLAAAPMPTAAPPSPTVTADARPPAALTPSQLQILLDADPENMQKFYRMLVAEQHPAAALVLATIAVQTGDLLQARATLLQYLQKVPDDPAAHYNLAQLMLRDSQPDLEAAREHYRRARQGGAPRDEDLEIVLNF